MATEFRKTGISVVGDVPWGTHFCNFYETKQDLFDTLVPYFKAGLESKEFCLWVVSNSDLITVEEAKGALKQAVPDLDRHLSDENIEILNGLDWYLKENAFNLERVTSAWDAKLKRALARGYDGLRVSGDTFWLREKHWKDFSAYEKQLNDSITDQPMTVLCTYPLAKSGAAEMLDVVQTHQFAIARRQGEWKVIQSPELIQAKAEIKRLNEELQRDRKRTPSRPLILRYGVAVLSVAASLIIVRWMETVLGSASHVSLLLCAIMFSTWFGGVGPGLLAIGLSLLAFDYYFVTPIHSLAVAIREIPRFLMFALSAFFVGSLSARQRSAAESLRHARDVLDGTVQELKRANESLHARIAERKHAEALLHAREQEFRAIVENAPDHIARYDREFRRTYVNPALAKSYDLPAEALIGKPMFSIIRDAGLDIKEDELAQIRQRFAAVFDTGKSYEFEITLPMPPGRRDYNVRLFPELDLNGSVINVLSIARDITKRKQAEDALRRSEDHLRLVIDAIPTMAWSLGPDGVVDFLNQRWMDYTGLSLEKFNEAPMGPIHPEDVPRVEERWRMEIAIGEPYDEEMRLRRADGEYRWFLVRTAPLRDERGTLVKWYGVSIDIEDRKRAEEKLKAISDQLRALSARVQSAKEEEATRIAREIHDELGSALTSLRWDLEGLERVFSKSVKESQVPALQQKLSAMLGLTDMTINIVRRIASELRPSVLDDLGLAVAIRWHARQFQDRTGIVVNCDCPLDDDNLNQEQLTAVFRIFQEALTNILRHAQATRVDVTIVARAGAFILAIRDNGRGITEDEKSGPQAIGLLGMRERAHLIGAEIEITGVKGEGTVVTVRLPIVSR